MSGTVTSRRDTLFVWDPTSLGPGLELNDSLTRVSVSASSGHGAMVLGSRGFRRGVHYWEVKIHKTQNTHTWVGVSPRILDPRRRRLSRFPGDGYGFVSSSGEYEGMGDQFLLSVQSNGDVAWGAIPVFNDEVVGVRLDMDRGTVSFLKDGTYLGQIKVEDLGEPYSELLQREQCLYPCVGLQKPGDYFEIMPGRFQEDEDSANGLEHNDDVIIQGATMLQLWGPSKAPPGAAAAAAAAGAGAGAGAGTGAGAGAGGVSNELAADSAPPTPLPPAVVSAAYATYSNFMLRQWRYTGARTRAGLPVFVDRTNEAIRALLPAGSSAEVKALRGGDEFLIKHGDANNPRAVLLGAAHGRIWYEVERDPGAWSWSGEEAATRLAMGFAAAKATPAGDVSGLMPCSLCKQNFDPNVMDAHNLQCTVMLPRPAKVAADAAIEAKASKAPAILTQEEFASAVAKAHWTLGTEKLLVKLVNSACDSQSCEPAFAYVQLLRDRYNHADNAELKTRTGGDFDGSVLPRFSLLLLLNQRLARVLPLVNLTLDRPALIVADPSQIRYKSALGRRLVAMRALLFNRTKRAYFDSILRDTRVTATSPDPWQPPDQLRKFRMRSELYGGDGGGGGLADASSPPSYETKLRNSMLYQLQTKMSSWNYWRLEYRGPSTGGELRSFLVEFGSEGAHPSDAGGPYSHVLTSATSTDPVELGMFVVNRNNVDEFGNTRAQLVIATGTDANNGMHRGGAAAGAGAGAGAGSGAEGAAAAAPSNTPRDELVRRFEFLGALIGMAVRQGRIVPIMLSNLVWRPLVGCAVGSTDLAAVWANLERALHRLRTSPDVCVCVGFGLCVSMCS